MSFVGNISSDVKQYLVVTANYWAFTLTDGALRMLVILHFHMQGFSPIKIATLFIFYEIFGVITNLVGGWLGARLGLNRTMNTGLLLQVIALAMLMVPSSLLTVVWVMVAQALSGIAKDLNKMSAKSAIKLLVPENESRQLFRWVAILTGSKNALKGIGFFLGGGLLTLVGFQGAMLAMSAGLLLVLVGSLYLLKQDLGRSQFKPKFSDLFSKSRSINVLSAARLLLFAARDVWFVVALPVYLAIEFNWSHWSIGSFLAIWVIGYGFVQAQAPRILRILRAGNQDSQNDQPPNGRDAMIWAGALMGIPTVIAVLLSPSIGLLNQYAQLALIVGLLLFGAVFAVNSALHSFLIVSYAGRDGVSLDVGFYYMANAMGRLLGTILSGAVFQYYGLTACLVISSIFLLLTALLSIALPRRALAK